MACCQTLESVTVNTLLEHIQNAYWERNQLFAMVLELTARCSCRCRHCYIVHDQLPGPELTTAEVCDLLDQAATEGVMQLMLSGGEVLLRQDLSEILAHARRHRFFVTVLTSGLPLDDRIADMLAAHHVYAEVPKQIQPGNSLSDCRAISWVSQWLILCTHVYSN